MGSYDTRDGSWETGEHWGDTSSLGDRASFDAYPRPPAYTTSTPQIMTPQTNKKMKEKRSVHSSNKYVNSSSTKHRVQQTFATGKTTDRRGNNATLLLFYRNWNNFYASQPENSGREKRTPRNSSSRDAAVDGNLASGTYISLRETNHKQYSSLTTENSSMRHRSQVSRELPSSFRNKTCIVRKRKKKVWKHEFTYPNKRKEKVLFDLCSNNGYKMCIREQPNNNINRTYNFTDKYNVELSYIQQNVAQTEISNFTKNTDHIASPDTNRIQWKREINKFTHFRDIGKGNLENKKLLPRALNANTQFVTTEITTPFPIQNEESYNPNLGALKLDKVRASDDGMFRCRVEYRRAPTSYSATKLFVVREYKTDLSNNVT